MSDKIDLGPKWQGDSRFDPLAKAGGYPVGTIRPWSGKQYQKQADKTWKEVTKPKEAGSKQEESKEGGKSLEDVRSIVQRVMGDVQAIENSNNTFSVKFGPGQFLDTDGKMGDYHDSVEFKTKEEAKEALRNYVLDHVNEDTKSPNQGIKKQAEKVLKEHNDWIDDSISNTMSDYDGEDLDEMAETLTTYLEENEMAGGLPEKWDVVRDHVKEDIKVRFKEAIGDSDYEGDEDEDYMSEEDDKKENDSSKESKELTEKEKSAMNSLNFHFTSKPASYKEIGYSMPNSKNMTQEYKDIIEKLPTISLMDNLDFAGGQFKNEKPPQHFVGALPNGKFILVDTSGYSYVRYAAKLPGFKK